MYSASVMLKFYWGVIRGKQRSKKTTWVRGGENVKKLDLHWFPVLKEPWMWMSLYTLSSFLGKT